MIELNKIYNEDCIQGLSKLPDSFCDLIIADPPYVISKESNFHTMPDRKIKGLVQILENGIKNLIIMNG